MIIVHGALAQPGTTVSIAYMAPQFGGGSGGEDDGGSPPATTTVKRSGFLRGVGRMLPRCIVFLALMLA